MTVTNELDSMCGISDEELTRRFKESIRIDDEVRKIKGLPVARYDDKTQRAYLEYPDGRREYVGERSNKFGEKSLNDTQKEILMLIKENGSNSALSIAKNLI